MDSVKLLNRTDTKFVFGIDQLPEILDKVKDDYQVLEVSGNRISRYKTLYFDTEKFDFYMHHHNGWVDRFKVRMRKYIESNLCFLEIKHKVKGRTVKSRTKISDFELELSNDSNDYISNILYTPTDLEAKLWNSFSRITLVNNAKKERMTIDLDLGFEFGDRKGDGSHVVIAEVKQEKASRDSALIQTVKKMGIRPLRISKYCIGTVMLYPELKYNKFKEKILHLNKLKRA